jgi:release factor glutamine methyltransferase
MNPLIPVKTWQIAGTVVWEWYQQAILAALAADIAQRELDWLIQAVSDVDRLSLKLGNLPPTVNLRRPWPDIVKLWQRRIQHRTPVQYLVGSTPWRDLELQVSPDVLIPRPETELLIDIAIAQTPVAEGNWLDLGTGSGAIAIGLATTFPEIQVHAVDLSAAALAIAQANAQNNGFSDRIKFYQGAWWEPIDHLRSQCQGMISNPPYIPTKTVQTLDPEVTKHEPHLALDGGVDGLDCIRELVNGAPDFLVPSGLWAIEMMAGQGAAVSELLQQQGSYRDIQIIDDWAGFDRFVIAHRI